MASSHPRRDDPRHHRSERASTSACRPSRCRSTASTRASAAEDPRSARDLRLGRRLLRDRSHRATRQGRAAASCGSGWSTTTPPRRSTGRSRRSSRSPRRPWCDPRPESIQARLARRFRPGRAPPHQAAVGPPFDRRGPARHRGPDRHPLAGLRLRDRRHRSAVGRATTARGRSTPELFEAFPDNAFALSEIVSARRASSRSRRSAARIAGRGPGCRRPGWRSRSRS